MKKPFLKKGGSRSGLFCLWASFLILSLSLTPTGIAFASDGATEALEMRFQAEMAIAGERASGHAKLAQAMEQALPGLLQEYLTTRDGTIALDTVDAAFVEERFKVARAMEEPGVALALDVYAGPGTGYEHGLQTALARLADFNVRMAGHASEAALDAHERVMERHLEKLQEGLDNTEALQDRLAAKLDSFDRTLEETKVESVVEKAEVRIETVVEKAETKIESIVEQAEEKIEASPEKTETITEKAESKIEKIVEQAEGKIGQIADSAVAKIETASSDTVTDSDTLPKEKKGKK